MAFFQLIRNAIMKKRALEVRLVIVMKSMCTLALCARLTSNLQGVMAKSSLFDDTVVVISTETGKNK